MATTQTFDAPIHAGDLNFERVLGAGLPVAALFWSGKIDSTLDAELNAVARAEASKLLVVKIKTDENPELTRRFAIHANPTLVTIRDKLEYSRADNMTPNLLREHLAYLLGRGPKPAVAQPAQREQPFTRPPTPPSPGKDGGAATGKPITVTDATFERDVMWRRRHY